MQKAAKAHHHLLTLVISTIYNLYHEGYKSQHPLALVLSRDFTPSKQQQSLGEEWLRRECRS